MKKATLAWMFRLIALGSLAGLVAVQVFGQEIAACFRDPKRYIDHHAVDLTPLFDWWQNQPAPEVLPQGRGAPAAHPQAPRPLTAWFRVRSLHLNKVSHGFMMDAEIQSTPSGNFSERIFLVHAPIAEQKRVDQALERIKELEHYRERMDRLSASELEKSRHLASQSPYLNVDGVTYNIDFTGTAWLYQQSANAAYERSEQAADNSLKAQAEQEKLRHETAPWLAADKYFVDDFALRTGKTYHGLPIYDVGRISR